MSNSQQMDLLQVAEQAPRVPIHFDKGELLNRFVQVERYHGTPTYWTPSGEAGSRRHGQVGVAIASIILKHSGGYEVVLIFSDGKMDSFNPQMLFPAKIPTPQK